jgi:organic hydroperoxide reductase OsmC/OhrA
MAAKISPFPHTYTVTLEDRQMLAPPRAPIAVGPPPQFGGTDDRWSPEELLVASSLECLWTTFEAYARRDRLTVERFAGGGTAVLDRGPGVPVFTSLTLHIDLQVGPGDEARARKLLELAESKCIISNVLKVRVGLDVAVSASAAIPQSA